MFGHQRSRRKKSARSNHSRQAPANFEQETDPKRVQRAVENPDLESLTPEVVMQLQRTHGNQFVMQLTRQSTPAVSVSQQVPSGGALPIQREPGDYLRQHYAEWNRVKSDRKEIDSDIYLLMQDIIVKGKYDSGKLNRLEQLVLERQGTSKLAKRKRVLAAILTAIESERGDPSVGLSDIHTYLNSDEFQQVLAEATPNDKVDGAFLKARTKILKKLFEMNQNLKDVTRSQLPVQAKKAAQFGVINGCWVGRGMCDIAAEAFGMRTEFQPNGEITWNHYIVSHGKTWTDPTYRQFFSPSDWAVGPGIFEGTADDFRSLGLNDDKTEAYLRFIHRA